MRDPWKTGKRNRGWRPGKPATYSTLAHKEQRMDPNRIPYNQTLPDLDKAKYPLTPKDEGAVILANGRLRILFTTLCNFRPRQLSAVLLSLSSLSCEVDVFEDFSISGIRFYFGCESMGGYAPSSVFDAPGRATLKAAFDEWNADIAHPRARLAGSFDRPFCAVKPLKYGSGVTANASYQSIEVTFEPPEACDEPCRRRLVLRGLRTLMSLDP